jgi:Ni,Fe-hydrogenase III large subunit
MNAIGPQPPDARRDRSATAPAAPDDARVRWVTNGEAVPLAELPCIAADELAAVCAALVAQGSRIAALTALPAPRAAIGHRIVTVLADDAGSRLGIVCADVDADGRYPAVTPILPQAQAFERELYEQWNLRPEGHPWLKPLRVHAAFAPPHAAAREAAPHPFFQVEGEGVHEVAVGPVHAGVIEPGHFRFQCFGEEVLHLEIQLGYQRRGAEALLLRSAPARRLVIAESLAGDTAIGHALAWSGACEALAGVEPPLAAHGVRAVALELERLANHAGDLGALCNDVGFLPGAAWFGRLRGEFLNVLLELSGNRFGRGLLRPGGVTMTLAAAERPRLLARLADAERDLRRLADLTLENTSVAARFERTGVLSRPLADALGAVGPVARASGCDRDVRRDHPAGMFRFAHVPAAVAESGDVMARALVRVIEAQRSLAFVREQLAGMGEGPLAVDLPPMRPECLAITLVEGWRGEIAHLAVTAADGGLAAWKPVDPSFHNWFALAMAMRGNPISDFPLCNKSFNLSYAGHDL